MQRDKLRVRVARSTASRAFQSVFPEFLLISGSGFVADNCLVRKLAGGWQPHSASAAANHSYARRGRHEEGSIETRRSAGRRRRSCCRWPRRDSAPAQAPSRSCRPASPATTASGARTWRQDRARDRRAEAGGHWQGTEVAALRQLRSRPGRARGGTLAAARMPKTAGNAAATR